MDFETERAKLKARRLAKKGFERQTGKTWDSGISQHEWEIYQAQVKRHEEALLEQKREEEAAAILAANIQHKEIVLQQLQTDMANKIKQIEDGKEALEKFRLDFEESVQQQIPSSSSVEKSAAMRMREEAERKKLRAAWRNTTDNPDDIVQKTRRDILVAKDDVAALNLRIINLKKELNKMKEIAEREVSAKQIMRDEKKKREEMKRMGVEPPRAAPKPKLPPAPPVPRAHQQRMAEQHARKMKARAERLSSSSASSSSAMSSSSSTKQSP